MNPELQMALEALNDSLEADVRLRPHELPLLAEHMEIVEFETAQKVMALGEPAHYVALVLRGRVGVHLHGLRVQSLTPPQLVGESAFLMDATRKADVYAEVPTTLARLTTKAHERMTLRSPALGLKLRNVCESIWRERTADNARLYFRDRREYIALIAHDGRKQELMDFVAGRRDFFARQNIVATETTGTRLYETVGLSLAKRVSSGPLGGDQAIGSMIASGNIRAVFFFRDPLSPHPHQADIYALGRLCDVYQILLATNQGTAAAVVDFLEREQAGEMLPRHEHRRAVEAEAEEALRQAVASTSAGSSFTKGRIPSGFTKSSS